MNALLAVGLALAGAKFAGLAETESEDLKVEKLESYEKPNGENIYESHDHKKNQGILYNKLSQRAKDSLKTGVTGVVPFRYNELSKDERGNSKVTFRESDFLLKPEDEVNPDFGEIEINKDNIFLENELRIMNNNSNEKKYYEETKNDTSYLEQFEAITFDNKGDPTAVNGVYESDDKMKQLNLERQLGLEQGWSTFNKHKNMTYNVVEAKDFKHNNMQPYFRKGSYGSAERDEKMALVNQQKLELFTGSSNQVGNNHKKEVEAMFKPQMGLSNVYGSPTIIGQARERYEMSLTDNRRHQSEFPVEQIRPNKGLDLDYYEHGNDGFHPWFRPLPKTVDDLRTADKQKISLGNVIVPGMRGFKRGIQAPVNKNRPETFFVNDPKNILPTRGYLTGQAPRENYFLKTTLREQQMRAYAGNQYGNDIGQNMPEEMFPKVRLDNRQNTGNLGVRNVHENTGIMRPDIQIGQNERSTTTINEWVGQAHPYDLGFVIDPLDVPDVTMKQMTLYDNAKYTDIGGHIARGAHAYDPNDVAKTTMKELGLYEHTGILGPEYKAGKTYNPKDVAKTTMKELTIDTDRAGNVIGQILGTLKPTDPQKTTMRQIIENNDHSGHIAPYSKYYAVDYTDVAPTTLRQLIENNVHVTNANRESKNEYVFNPQEAKTTMRQITENNKHVINANRESQNEYVFNPQAAKTTMRQITENNRYVINANRESKNEYVFNPQEAKTTMRQMTENNKHVINANRESKNEYVFNPQAAKTTMRQMTENNKHVINANRESKNEYVFNPQATKTTMRQMTENNKHVTNANRESQTQYVFNPQAAKTTMRQMTENNKHVINVNRESQTGYMTNPKEAKTTMRQMTENNKFILGVNRESQTGYMTNPKYVKPTVKQSTLYSYIGQSDGQQNTTGYMTNKYYNKPTVKQSTLYSYIGNSESQVSRNAVYEHYYNAPIDDKKQIAVMTGRMPTLRNYDMIPDGHLTLYPVKDDADVRHMPNRALMGNDGQYNPHQQWLPNCSTRVHQYLDQNDRRLDPAMLTQLNTNPYMIQLNPICNNGQTYPMSDTILMDMPNPELSTAWQQAEKPKSYGDINFGN
jgi:predicted component of type VI protein secretion system